MSQPFVIGRAAAIEEIAQFFADLGYGRRNGQWFLNKIVIADAVPRNVIAREFHDGVALAPIDLNITQDSAPTVRP